MNVLNKLTIKNLKLNKKRTIVTIIGIILSTALICAVAGMVSSFQQTLINAAIDENGNNHITIQAVKKDDLKYYTNDRNVESYYLAENLGYANLSSSINKSKPYLYIKSYTNDGFRSANFKLVEGRFPKNEYEIVLTNTVNTNGKANLNIGDTLNLNIGKRILLSDGSELTQYNPIDDTDPEEIKELFTRTYTIVGFIERPNYNYEGYTSPGYTALTYLNESNENAKYDISMLFKDPKYTKTVTEKLDKEKVYKYMPNSDLLRWQFVNISDSTLTTLLFVASVVIIIIIVTSIFVIKNSFSISITEKTKQYGMLASVGATSKQIKKNVLYEGFIIGVIGIPLGILSGIFADYVLVIIINLLLGPSLNDMEFVFKIPMLPIILSVVLASITIFLSVISSARKSAKISPIEAIRNNNDIKISSKKLKTPKGIQKIFKMGGVIAYKNLKRSRKKYRTTVISLVVSIFVFISLSSFITYGFKMSGIYYQEYNYNIEVSANNDNQEMALKIYDDILNMGYIDKYAIHKNSTIDVDVTNITTDEMFFRLFGNSKNDSKIRTMPMNIISLGQDEYERYVKSIGGTVENYKNGAILIDEMMSYVDGKYIYNNMFTLKAGDSITGSKIEDGKEEGKTIPIVAKTNKRPMGLESTYSMNGYLIVSDEFINEIGIEHIGELYIKAKDATKLDESIKKYKNENKSNTFHYTNLEEMAKQQNSMVLLVAIFLYGFIIVISLIGVTNIFNTITTNMNLRQKEFAMLKSIGMTSKEFNRMIMLESIFYCSKSLLIGIPLGLIGSFFMYKAFANGAEFGYILPFNAIIISIVAVFILVSLIMHYSFKKINKQNIIETIRKENI